VIPTTGNGLFDMIEKGDGVQIGFFNSRHQGFPSPLQTKITIPKNMFPDKVLKLSPHMGKSGKAGSNVFNADSVIVKSANARQALKAVQNQRERERGSTSVK
jgi:hypothetical protein